MILEPILERADRALRLLERLVALGEVLAARPDSTAPTAAGIWKVKEAAACLKISESKLYRLAEDGELGQKVGGQWRFDEGEVRAYARGERRAGARVLPLAR